MNYDGYFGNDDATPERIRKARQAGLGADVADIYLPSGLPSGAKRRVIERPLDTALRREWITSEQKQAGDKFAIHMVGARAQIRFTTSRWEAVIDGRRFQNPIDLKRFHEHELRCALLRLHWKLRQPFLDWMAYSEQQDTNIIEFGAKFSKLKHREAQKEAGIFALGIILDDLAEHFGYIHRRNSWDTRRQLEELLSGNRSKWK